MYRGVVCINLGMVDFMIFQIAARALVQASRLNYVECSATLTLRFCQTRVLLHMAFLLIQYSGSTHSHAFP